MVESIFQSLGIVIDVFEPTTTYSDNQATITYVMDSEYHGKTKYIDTKNNFKKRYYCTKWGDPKIFTSMWNGCWSIHKIHSKGHFLYICKVIRTA